MISDTIEKSLIVRFSSSLISDIPTTVTEQMPR